MRDLPDDEYLTGLATELRHTPAVTQATEDDLARMRNVMARVATFINNPAHDLNTRTALANHLGLPGPAAERTTTP